MPSTALVSASAHGYVRDVADASDGQLSADDEAALHQKLSARREAQRTRDFAEADRLRDELRAIGVTLNDKARTYRLVADGALRRPVSRRPVSPHLRDGSTYDHSRSPATPFLSSPANVSPAAAQAARFAQLLGEGNEAVAREHRYLRQDDSTVVVSALDQETIDQLLLQRVYATQQRLFNVADGLNAFLGEIASEDKCCPSLPHSRCR